MVAIEDTRNANVPVGDQNFASYYTCYRQLLTWGSDLHAVQVSQALDPVAAQPVVRSRQPRPGQRVAPLAVAAEELHAMEKVGCFAERQQPGQVLLAEIPCTRSDEAVGRAAVEDAEKGDRDAGKPDEEAAEQRTLRASREDERKTKYVKQSEEIKTNHPMKPTLRRRLLVLRMLHHLVLMRGLIKDV